MSLLPFEDKEKLESMVDEHYLHTVISVLAIICFEKEDHLAVDWQDEKSAEVWQKRGKLLLQFAKML